MPPTTRTMHAIPLLVSARSQHREQDSMKTAAYLVQTGIANNGFRKHFAGMNSHVRMILAV